MRLAGEVKASPHVPLWGDDPLREPVVQSVQDVRRLVHDRVVEVRLNLGEDGLADLVSNV